MSSITRQGCPASKRDVWVRQTQGENALYDPATGTVHMLNETAQAIWELCDGETLPEEMISAICQLFSMHRDVVTEDIERILGDLDRAGLISWVS